MHGNAAEFGVRNVHQGLALLDVGVLHQLIDGQHGADGAFKRAKMRQIHFKRPLLHKITDPPVKFIDIGKPCRVGRESLIRDQLGRSDGPHDAFGHALR